MKSYVFLFWAYNLVWLAIVGYLVMMFARMKQLDRRLDALDRHTGRAEDRSS